MGRSASIPCTWVYPKKMDGRKFWYFTFLIHPLHELHIRAKSLGEIYTHTPRRLKCIKCICYDTINFIQIRSLQEYFEELHMCERNLNCSWKLLNSDGSPSTIFFVKGDREKRFLQICEQKRKNANHSREWGPPCNGKGCKGLPPGCGTLSWWTWWR